MKFKIIRSKFIEGLESINKIISENASKMVIITEKQNEVQMESSALLREGLVMDYFASKNLECPICGASVEKWENPFGEENTYTCEKCKASIPPEAYEQKAYCVCEKGVADFVAKTIGDIGHAQPIGDRNYRLGAYYGRDAYFCASPKEGFFNSLTQDALVITCDDSAVPRGWATNGCVIIRFAELFYTKNGLKEIRVADGVLKKLKKQEPTRRFTNARRINDRRDMWLSVISNIFVAPYSASDFRDGKLTSAAAHRWFKKVYPKFKRCARTLERDMTSFRTFNKSKDVYDMREPVITELLKKASEDSFSPEQRLQIAKNIAEIQVKVRNAEKRKDGVPVELPSTGWITDECGRSAAVPVTDKDATFEAVAMREKMKSLKITAA